MAEENIGIIEPKAEQLTLSGSLLGTFEVMAGRISSLQVFSVKVEPDSLSVLRVESHDMQKRPFLFILIIFKKDSIVVNYTVAQDSSPKMRKLYVIKVLLSILSLVSDVYQVKESELEAYSDESLMVMVEDWLEAHDNSIDINEFANSYKLSPTRVEQILNKMVSLGYIALKG